MIDPWTYQLLTCKHGIVLSDGFDPIWIEPSRWILKGEINQLLAVI